MTILYSNGCSFTANYEVPRPQRYPLLIGKHFNWQVVDRAIAGSCNSKIIRCSMRECISLLKHNEPIVALIQLTFKERFEYAGTCNDSNSWKYGRYGDQFESINPMDQQHWPSEITQYAKTHIALQQSEALNTNLLHGVIGLSSFFKTNNIRYLIYAGPSYAKESLESDLFYQYLVSDPDVLDLLKFDMLSLTGQQKHPTVDGMKTIADYFINRLAEPA
jgi:hypothetical protein